MDDMSWLRVGDLGDSTHSGPEDHGHVRVQSHFGNGLADNLLISAQKVLF